MDERRFGHAVLLVRIRLFRGPYNGLTPGGTHARALEIAVSDKKYLISALISLSEHKRWAFDALCAMALSALRDPTETMSRKLALWAATVLEGERKRPAKGKEKLANRNLKIADAVSFAMGIPGLRPTRSGAGPSDCCAEGGSACDIVGAALQMPYKTVERIWLKWGAHITADFDTKDSG